jgi:hypothetical protein
MKDGFSSTNTIRDVLTSNVLDPSTVSNPPSSCRGSCKKKLFYTNENNEKVFFLITLNYVST